MNMNMLGVGNYKRGGNGFIQHPSIQPIAIWSGNGGFERRIIHNQSLGDNWSELECLVCLKHPMMEVTTSLSA